MAGVTLDPKLRALQAKDRLRVSLWTAPAVAVVLAVVLAVLMIRLDRSVGWTGAGLLFDGGGESARELLSTIASSMLTFTALVFSITIVVLQLASNQFSPRVIRTFLEERTTKAAMAMFVGTFVYAVAVLAQVRTETPPFVPTFATWVALAMVLVSVGVFIGYIHEMAHSIRAITVIVRISAETREGIERMFAAHQGVSEHAHATAPHGEPTRVIHHREPPGVIAFIDIDELVQLAERDDAVIELVPKIGDFVPTGGALFRVWGEISAVDRCRAAVAMDIERTPPQDPAFGFRQLVDIAVRSLSPAVNDPTTAVQALDHLHDLLRRLTNREFPTHARFGAGGKVRLLVSTMDYAEYVRLAVEEIWAYGAGSVQVTRKLEHALVDCATLAEDPTRRAVLDEQLALLRGVDRAAASAQETR